MQLCHAEFDDGAVLARPDKACAFKALLQQPEAVAIPAQDLDAVMSAVAKDEDGVGKGVHAQGVFDQTGQAVDVFTKVDGILVQLDAV